MLLDDELLSEIRQQGYCILEGVVPSDRCAEIRSRIHSVVRRECGSYASPRRVGFVPSVINHDHSFADYLADRRLLALCHGLLGHGLRISFTSAIINEPGNQRGKWHADWPFNQNNAGHIAAPYPNLVMHLTTLWMLSPFSSENGGTWIVPSSHLRSSNPTAVDCPVRPDQSAPGEIQAVGPEGSVLLMDSRLWHATAANATDQARVALAVRYAPWWLNTEVLRPESGQREQMLEETGKSDNQVPSIQPAVFDQLPERVKPLYQHWLAQPATLRDTDS